MKKIFLIASLFCLASLNACNKTDDTTPTTPDNQTQYYTIKVENGHFEGYEETEISVEEYSVIIAIANEPQANFKFDGWFSNDNCVSTSKKYTFFATQDYTITATYSPISVNPNPEPTAYNISITGGYIQGYTDKNITVEENTSITIVAEVPENKEFVSWNLENGNILSILPTYTFNVTSNLTISAEFKNKDVTPAEGHTIYFSAGFANDVTNSVDSINNVTTTFTFPSGYSRTSYCPFLGWALTPVNPQKIYQPNEIYDGTIDGDMLFYAIWDETWTDWE